LRLDILSVSSRRLLIRWGRGNELVEYGLPAGTFIGFGGEKLANLGPAFGAACWDGLLLRPGNNIDKERFELV
jgi:hypothetical protein